MDESTKIIAELICSPVGVGVSLTAYVKEAVNAIEKYPNIRYMHHPMGTIIEADTLDQIFAVTKIAHEAILMKGAKRVVTQLRIDDRKDKSRRMEDKTSAIS